MLAERVVACRNQHGEGVFWDPVEGAVRWTDIEGRALWAYDPATEVVSTKPVQDRVCCFAPRSKGGLIVAFADRVVFLDPESDAEELILRFEPENPETRLNDGRTDRAGRFVLGGMNEVSGTAESSVISIGPDLSINTLIEGVACANSTCFSPDGATMYFADTPDREILAFDYDQSAGTLSNRRVHADLGSEPGLPDGSCVDAEGGVWNAEWEGRRVVRIAPGGEIDAVIDVPVWKPTCCAFGGPDLDTLFITTSRLMSDADMLSKEPESGDIFAIKPGIHGIIDAPFNG